jgi:O-antigen ligase
VLIVVAASVVAFRDVDYDGNLAGVFRTGNALGIVMCSVLYMCFMCWPARRVVLLAASALVVYVVFLTSSRSALAFLAVFFVLHLLGRWPSARKVALAVLLIAVSLYLVYMTQLEEFYPEYRFGGKRLFDGATGRMLIWEASLQEIARRPFGVGLGLSEEAMAPLVGQSGSHNALLKMTLEGGWLFGLSYVGLLGAMLRHSRLPLTQVFLIALNVKYLFEIATPFGLSLSSALLTLPFFMERTERRQP